MSSKLNKKLAEWAGFRYLPYKGSPEMLVPSEESESHVGIGKGYVWVHPDWVYGNDKWSLELPDFTHSLDACFKWLVPKVINDAKYSVIITQNLAQSIGYVRPLQSGKQYDAIDNHNPALSLCLAIEKLIDSEK